MLRLFEIFVPEMDTYVKFKVLPPEDLKTFVDSAGDLEEEEFVKIVLDNVVYNMRTEVTEAVRKMSPEARGRMLHSLYNGCIMLNPFIDLEKWINISFAARQDIVSPNLPVVEPEPVEEPEKPAAKKKLTRAKFINLKNHLASRVVGQPEAIEAVSNALARSYAGLGDTQRPLGVFLFAGSSGVGKTHLARELQKYLFGNDTDIIRVDCGEYQHKHDNQKLIGAPPGYIGHDEGGGLTNKVAETPNTVVLLDEVEKAHPDLFNTFLRIFDEGMVSDNKGRQVSFRNTIIIMTTNLGNDKVVESMTGRSAGFTGKIEASGMIKALPPRPQVERLAGEAIRKMFKPEFLNRIDRILVFNHLSQENYSDIAQLELDILDSKLAKKGITFKWDDSVVQALLNDGVDTVLGARGMSKVRRDELETLCANKIIHYKLPRGTIFEMTHNDGYQLRIRVPKKLEHQLEKTTE